MSIRVGHRCEKHRSENLLCEVVCTYCYRELEEERDEMKRAIEFACDLTDITSMSYFLHAYRRGDEEYLKEKWPEFYEGQK